MNMFSIALAIVGGRVESWLPIGYKLQVVFGLVVNFGDFEFLTQVSDWELETNEWEMTGQQSQ